ncbi:hypothetical protein BDY21DRAFT_420280 [Lineolata rhizophorae]|uniref:Uncharacterized protein n=1 Tax=Lineolata rhizophorae TaxID=578093 RepID=A0A6A6P4S5_9PEZI|nr:hypothetical protein BDY21DRAFT_420280 [Lineolata rhizophorae]
MSELLRFILAHEDAFKSRARLASLYSDFRLKATTNPDGYRSNVAAWTGALARAARAGALPAGGASGGGEARHLLALRSGRALETALETDECGRPLSLGAVLHDAVASGDMMPEREFLAARASVYDQSMVWRLYQWLFPPKPAGASAKGLEAPEESFVVMANLEEAASAVLARLARTHTSSYPPVFSLQTFQSTFADVLSPTTPSNPTPLLSPHDTRLLLTHLTRDKRAARFDPAGPHGGTIKFAHPSMAAAAASGHAPAQPDPITDRDAALASLTTAAGSLAGSLAALDAAIAVHAAAARDALAAAAAAAPGPAARARALAALRAKRAAQARRDARGAALERVREALGAVEDAADQAVAVRAMRDAAAVLKGLRAEVGGVRGVEGVVDEVREEMRRVEEVGRAVGEGSAAGGAGALDEVEVEGELERLEREERARGEREREERAAEATRSRLEVLDKTEAERREREARKVSAPPAESAEKGEEKGVEESIADFGRMSLEETPAAGAPKKSESGQAHDKEAQMAS